MFSIKLVLLTISFVLFSVDATSTLKGNNVKVHLKTEDGTTGGDKAGEEPIVCAEGKIKFGTNCLESTDDQPEHSFRNEDGTEYLCHTGADAVCETVNDSNKCYCNCEQDYIPFGDFCVTTQPQNSLIVIHNLTNEIVSYGCNTGANAVCETDNDSEKCYCKCNNGLIPFGDYCADALTPPRYSIQKMNGDNIERFECPNTFDLIPAVTKNNVLYCKCPEKTEGSQQTQMLFEGVQCLPTQPDMSVQIFDKQDSDQKEVIAYECNTNTVLTKSTVSDQEVYSCLCDIQNNYFKTNENQPTCIQCNPDNQYFDGNTCKCKEQFVLYSDNCVEFCPKDSNTQECQCPLNSHLANGIKCECDKGFELTKDTNNNNQYKCEPICEVYEEYDGEQCTCNPLNVFDERCLPLTEKITDSDEQSPRYKCVANAQPIQVEPTRKRAGGNGEEQKPVNGCICNDHYEPNYKENKCIYSCEGDHQIPNAANNKCTCEDGYTEVTENGNTICVTYCNEDDQIMESGKCVCKDPTKFAVGRSCLTTLPQLVGIVDGVYNCVTNAESVNPNGVDERGCVCKNFEEVQFFPNEQQTLCSTCDPTKKLKPNADNTGCVCMDGYINNATGTNGDIQCVMECGEFQELALPPLMDNLAPLLKRDDNQPQTDDKQETTDENDTPNVNSWDYICRCKENYVNVNEETEQPMKCVYSCNSTLDMFTDLNNTGCMCGDRTIKETVKDKDGNILSYKCVNGTSMVALLLFVFFLMVIV